MKLFLSFSLSLSLFWLVVLPLSLFFWLVVPLSLSLFLVGPSLFLFLLVGRYLSLFVSSGWLFSLPLSFFFFGWSFPPPLSFCFFWLVVLTSLFVFSGWSFSPLCLFVFWLIVPLSLFVFWLNVPLFSVVGWSFSFFLVDRSSLLSFSCFGCSSPVSSSNCFVLGWSFLSLFSCWLVVPFFLLVFFELDPDGNVSHEISPKNRTRLSKQKADRYSNTEVQHPTLICTQFPLKQSEQKTTTNSEVGTKSGDFSAAGRSSLCFSLLVVPLCLLFLVGRFSLSVLCLACSFLSLSSFWLVVLLSLLFFFWLVVLLSLSLLEVVSSSIFFLFF